MLGTYRISSWYAFPIGGIIVLNGVGSIENFPGHIVLTTGASLVKQNGKAWFSLFIEVTKFEQFHSVLTTGANSCSSVSLIHSPMRKLKNILRIRTLADRQIKFLKYVCI